MEFNWHAALVMSNIVALVCAWVSNRRYGQALEENIELLKTAELQKKSAESAARVAAVKLDIECKVSAGLRGTVDIWRARYHDLWRETHLGDDDRE